MDEQAGNLDTTRLGGELDAALTALESVLAEASRTVVGIRSTLPQIAALGQVVGELEAAMSNARRYLGIDADTVAEPETPAAIASEPAPAPPAEAIAAPPAEHPAPEPPVVTKVIEPEAEVPEVTTPAPPLSASLPESAVEIARAEEAAPAPSEPETDPIAEVTSFAPAQPEPAAPEPQIVESPGAPVEAEPGSAAEASYNLQLRVSTTSGSLDLKAVDRSVNENPGVVDVTLLDYDGRKATLKVWIDPDADPRAVQDGLLTSLKQHLAQGQEANVIIDVEGEAVA